MDYKQRKDSIINPEWCVTPDMGEYITNDMIEAMAEDLENSVTDGEYFIDAPFSTILGYHEVENAFVISVSKKDNIGVIDGDTIRINYTDILDGNKSFNFMADNKEYNNVKDFLYQTLDLTSITDQISVRLVGANAPEVPHCRYSYVPENVKFYYAKYSELLENNRINMYSTPNGMISECVANRDDCQFVRFDYDIYGSENSEFSISYEGKRNHDSWIKFIKNTVDGSDIYYEVMGGPYDKKLLDDINLPVYYICFSSSCNNNDPENEDYYRQGLQAHSEIENLLDKSSEVLFVLDGSCFKSQKNNIPLEYQSESIKMSQDPTYAFKSFYNQIIGVEKTYKRLGYNYFGQEYNGRILGAMYVKYQDESKGEIWINVEKYLAGRNDKYEILPSYSTSPENISSFNYESDAFKLWTYDKDRIKYIDKYNDFYSKYGGDDREKVQKELTGTDLSSMKEYTVMIGDCLLMVPPTSIRLVSQINSQRTSLIRAKGSITKTLPKTDRILEMQLFFNGEQGINGVPYVQEFPSKQKMTFYMNGLRALIAQFKFTPFLPIENNYINQVLNIEAVTLNSIQINTVPNFPKTLQVVIRLRDFEYRQFMPEILPPNINKKEDITKNLFSQTIHFPVMRYYYQKAILQGEYVKLLDFNTDPYINATIGQKTVLQPMKFKDPLIDFYIANEEHLKQRKQLKDALEKRPLETVVQYTDQEKDFLEQLAKMNVAVTSYLAAVKKDFSNLNNSFDANVDFYGLKEDIDTGKYIDKTIEEANNKCGFYMNHMDSNETYTEYLEPIYKALKDEVNNDKNGFDHSILSNGIKPICRIYKNKEEKLESSSITILFGYQIKIDWVKGSPKLINKIKQDYGKRLAVDTALIFADDNITIGYTISLYENETANEDKSKFFKEYLNSSETKAGNFYRTIYGISGGFNLSSSGGENNYVNIDYNVLNKICNDYGYQLDKNGNVIVEGNEFFSQNQALAEMKNNIDLETNKSMVFDKYPIQNLIIENASISYNNNFTRMSLTAMDGYVSQYLGAADTMLELNIKTRDKESVTALQTLPRCCADRLIKYRKIMTCSPLRINSELTKFFGINEVVIDSIDINTVPNYPGLYAINMKLISVDRTLRNREALKKIDVNNASYNNDSKLKAKSYFDLQAKLAQVELYPDLELPTLNELSKLGYGFIRYKTDTNRIFPDADFYFVYLHAYSSEMIREAIVKYFSDSNNTQILRNVAGDLDGCSRNVGLSLVPDKYDNKLITDEGAAEDNNPESDELIQELYNAAEENFQNTSIKYEGFECDKETFEKINKQLDEENQKLLELQENLECANYSTYDFNHYIKMSLKDTEEYGQLISTIRNNNKNNNDNNPDDNESYLDLNAINLINSTLKDKIKEILDTPINPKDSFLKDDIYGEFVDYLCKDILGMEDGIKSSYTINVDNGEIVKAAIDFSSDVPITGTKYAISNCVLPFLRENLRVALSSGLTGKSSILDYNKDERTENKDKWIGTASTTDSEGNRVINVLVNSYGQGLSDYMLFDKSENNIYNEGMVFGPFAIKKYDSSYLSVIYNNAIIDGTYGFLDPYYNSDVHKILYGEGIDKEEEQSRIKEYIDGITETDWNNEEYSNGDIKYAYIAVFREMLVWFYNLLNNEDSSFLPTAFFTMKNLIKILGEGDFQTKDIADRVIEMSLFSSVKQKFVDLGMWAEGAIVDLYSIFDEDNNWKKDYESTKALEDRKKQLNEEVEKTLKDLKDNLIVQQVNLVCGLFSILGGLVVGGIDTPIYSAITNDNISGLMDYCETIKSKYIEYDDLNEIDMKMRNYFSYLDKQEFDYSFSWTKYVNPLSKYSATARDQRIYLKAAEIPQVYMLHSFYDMVVHDMRGRMARAFPTYYMLLIDEGREFGMWHLQDNFYDVSSISEFQVVRSRKIAADTAVINMTNLFGTFTTEDEDMKDEYTTTFRDAFNSIFSPRVYYMKEYERRYNAMEFNRAKIKPGARVHLRLGYEGDASRLPVIFNGNVAEVNPVGDMIQILCQGDGIELSNPDMFNASDASDIGDLKYSDYFLGGLYGLFNQSTTARDILVNPLMSSGTWIKSVIKNFSNGRFFNDNPFGIVHFGDKYFKEVFLNNGEMEQNIYEGINKPTWYKEGNSSFNESIWSMETAPKVKIDITGKSYWDLMNIAASISPDFICTTTLFNTRSSIFYGAPRYYYAYDYIKDSNGHIREKRKPFQQYHIYTSYTDIIGNTITASNKNIKTCAVGVYKGPGVLTKTQKTCGPLYLDINIYPEFQKMMTVNCEFEYKNTNLPFTIPVFDDISNELLKDGGDKIAWRSTANALRNSVKDMYTGELIVMGDPAVKPYDKMMIYDIYSDMQGISDIEATVQTMSIETGYTTSISPDCSVAIDDKYDKISHVVTKECLLPFLSALSSTTILSNYFSKIVRPMFFTMANLSKKAINISDAIVGQVKNVIGKENISLFGGLTDNMLGTLGAAFDVTSADYLIYNTITDLTKSVKGITVEHTFKKGSDLINFFEDLASQEKNLSNINPAQLRSQLEDALSQTSNKKTQQAIKNALNSLDDLSDSYIDMKKGFNNFTIAKEEIDVILKSIPADKMDDIADAIESLKKVQGSVAATDKSFIEVVNNLSKVSQSIDDLDNTELVTVLKNMDTKAFKNAQNCIDKFDNISDTFAEVNTLKKGASSIKVAITKNLLFLAAQIILGKLTQEYLERKLKNMQVLTVFPLMKNNYVLTAGLDGNMGSVFDSPNYNKEGFLQKIAIDFFDGKYAHGIFNFLLDCFVDTSTMKEIVNKYKRDNSYGSYNLSAEGNQTQLINSLINSVINNEANGVEAYRKLFLEPRLVSTNSTDFNEAFKSNALINIVDPESDKKLQNSLVYIFQNPTLKKFNQPDNKESPVLLFSAQKNSEQEDKNGNSIYTCDLSLHPASEGENTQIIKCKKIIRNDRDLPIYDIPLLRPDAYIVFLKIVNTIIAKLQKDNSSTNSTLDELHNHNIIIHNCTRINDENSWFCTGYEFTIEVKDYPEIENIIKELYDSQQTIFDNDNNPGKLFMYNKDTSLGENCFNIMVSPRLPGREYDFIVPDDDNQQ